MPNKIKVILILVAIVAVFSVYKLTQYVHKIANESSTYQDGSALANSDNDSDQDGLTNREESYWNTDFQNPDTDGDGFLDGEEVASGHDPLIPGPNDLLDNGNLTNKLSGLTVSGLYEGSLVPGNPNYDKSLTDMALVVMDDATKNLNPEIDINKLKTESSSKKNEEVYLEEISGPFENLLKTYGDEMNNLQKYLEIIGNTGFSDKDISAYFQDKENELQIIFNKAQSISIPQNFVPAHIYFLNFIKTLQIANNSIAHGSEDPIKALAGLNALGDSLVNLPKLIEPFIDKIKSENLYNPFFKSLMQ